MFSCVRAVCLRVALAFECGPFPSHFLLGDVHVSTGSEKRRGERKSYADGMGCLPEEGGSCRWERESECFLPEVCDSFGLLLAKLNFSTECVFMLGQE